MSLSSKIRVAVLRGGPSYGYDTSLKTGAYVLSLLRELPELYEPEDIFISKDGEWHQGGLVQEPHQALRHADVVWNALHGAYGEDGQVQRILENLRVPFTGSGTLSASLATNKDMTKSLYRRHLLLTPESTLMTEENFNDEALIAIFRSYLHPVVVKPADGVHALGVRLAHSFKELKEAVKETFSHSRKVLVEEFIKGKEATGVVIEQAKGERIYALMPTGKASVEENKRIGEMSRVAHEILGQRHYSSSDFIITPKGKIYILETNSLPVLCEDSLMHRALKATGWNPRDFAEHCVKLAMNKFPETVL